VQQRSLYSGEKGIVIGIGTTAVDFGMGEKEWTQLQIQLGQ
jgi:hypothetical protein